MKCDDFVPNLTTGGLLRRWLARRHAASCPRCAETAIGLKEIQQALAATSPLTAAQRHLWLQAAPAPAPLARPAPLLHWGRLAACACAALAVTLTILSLGPRPGDKRPAPPRQVAAPSRDAATPHRVAQVDPSREFARLEAEVALAQQELDALMERAKLLQASQQATQLIAEYSRW